MNYLSSFLDSKGALLKAEQPSVSIEKGISYCLNKETLLSPKRKLIECLPLIFFLCRLFCMEIYQRTKKILSTCLIINVQVKHLHIFVINYRSDQGSFYFSCS